MTTALVCGGRHYNDTLELFRALDLHEPAITEMICGGATGADQLATDWARGRSICCTVYPADWKQWGRAAGPKRNKQMLVEGKPDIVLAFSGGAGTAHMIRIAWGAQVPVYQWVEGCWKYTR